MDRPRRHTSRRARVLPSSRLSEVVVMGDSEFDYSSDEVVERGGRGAGGKVVENQPHDEEVALPSDEDASSVEEEVPQTAAPRAAPARSDARPADASSSSRASAGNAVPAPAASTRNPRAARDAPVDVPPEIRELFEYVDRYQPRDADLPAPLKPFVPDYIPAVGGCDEFVKIPRPDGRPDELGLRVLDEPGPRQTDPTVLALKLRRASKRQGSRAPGGFDTTHPASSSGGTPAGPAPVNRIAEPDAEPERLAVWIENVKSLNRASGGVSSAMSAARVSYGNAMPDAETLAEEWDPEVEEVLRTARLPDETLGMELGKQARLMCAALDIPVYEGKLVESLHVMFSTYVALKNNPYVAKAR